jgi:hypothetical protein
VELCLAGFAGSLAEQDIVSRIGIERRVEINHVNALIRKNLFIPQPLEHCRQLRRLPQGKFRQPPRPLIRASYGNSGGDGMQQPSRFLAEIPGDLLNQWNLRPSNSYQ